ncbi:hypothetical protein FB45DRAFT_1090837 [Roridomyces roridus]|uniref:Zn(2)-C6 fungal-type domain-containing protein n=1 Tax=Roridomyces roridus TaxID=1738132 RepID=A0AAD7BIR4_9AGAR|nr:hypothetical protein FB45DRAFT_1090837 [Roridomyces roridus]
MWNTVTKAVPLQRGQACINCRKRKIKCDGQRPVCTRCLRNPAKMRSPCHFDTPEPGIQDPALPMEGMPATELDLLCALPGDGRGELEVLEMPAMPEAFPSPVDIFFRRCATTPYFFLDATRPRYSVDNSCLLEHHGWGNCRLPALRSAIFLLGSILANVLIDNPYTSDTLLECLLQTVAAPGEGPPDFGSLFELLQTEILLSLYYLYAADPQEGWYHCATAVSLALQIRTHLDQVPSTGRQAQEYRNALLSVVIIRAHWIVAYGPPAPSAWRSDLEESIDVKKLLEETTDTLSPKELLAKACILFNLVSVSDSATANPNSFISLDKTLSSLQCAIPLARLHGTDNTLILTDALTNLAVIRLHSPYARVAEAARAKSLAAARRIVTSLAHVDLLNGVDGVDVLFGPIYAFTASFYISDIAFYQICTGPKAEATLRQIEMCLGKLMSALASLAVHGPIFEECYGRMRHAYAQIPVMAGP